MTMELDRIDRRILALLQKDASLSTNEIGEKIGLSQAACWRRIQRLEEGKFILGRVAVLNPELLDAGTLILVHVRLTEQGRAHIEEFSNKIRKMPEVLECLVLMGDQDFFLKIAVKDVNEYERFFFEHLSPLKGIAAMKSFMTLSRIKYESGIPVRE